MDKKKSIVISGYYGFDNSGDDAILKAIVKDFKNADSHIDITALSYNPPFTEKSYDIKAVNRFKLAEVRRAIKSCDLFISGGGSLLQDVTSTRSLIYYLTIMKLAKCYGKKIMVYANGVGPINKRLNRFLTKKILEKVDLITLRDQESFDFLKEIGLKNQRMAVTADPVFTLEAKPQSRIDEIFKNEGIPKDRPLIGISIRDWDNSRKLIEDLSLAIDEMVHNYKCNFLLIPMHYPEDLEISREIISRVKNKNSYLLEEKYAVDELMGIINTLDMIIAMRLHSLIYAASQGVPMVGIVYDPKIVGFLNSIKVDTMIYTDNFNKRELLENIDIVWQDRKNLRQELLEADENLKKEALRNISMALELLEE